MTADVDASRQSLGRWRGAGALAAIGLLGACLRLAALDRAPYSDDEVMTLVKAAGLAPSQWEGKEFSTGTLVEALEGSSQTPVRAVVVGLLENDAKHGPVYFVLQSLWARCFGSSLTALRSLGALLALGMIPLCYLLARQLGARERGALLAAALMAMAPIEVELARFARPYGLVGLETLAATTVMLAAVRRRRILPWLAYAALCTIGLYTHVAFALLILAHGVALAAWPEGRRALFGWASSVAGVAMLSAAFAYHALPAIHRNTVGLESALPTFSLPLHWPIHAARWILCVEVMRYRAAWSIVGPLAALAGASLLAMVLWQLRRCGRSDAFWLVLSGSLVPILGMGALDALTGANRSFVARYLSPCFPFMIVGTALALDQWRAARPERVSLRALEALLLLVALGSSLGLHAAEARRRESRQADARAVAGRLLVGGFFGRVAAIALHLPPTQRLFIFPDDGESTIPEPGPHAFTLQSARGKQRLTDAGWRIEPIVGAKLVTLLRRVRSGAETKTRMD